MNTTPDLYKKASEWLEAPFDMDTRRAVQELINNKPELLEECFYKDLEFGTGGMRGIMGPGTNRINQYTLGKSTQGICNYLKQVVPQEPLRVAIAYDCRINSDVLAQTVAAVFSANGIQVFLFSDMRPTPELSFAVRHLNCHCGIVLTASHNPPEYNGYKVYWSDGGQLVPPQDQEIIGVIESLSYNDINFAAKKDLICHIGEEVDRNFIRSTIENASFSTEAEAKNKLKIVFTSLHGTSIKLMPNVFREAGYSNVAVVAEQAIPDGTFPTVQSPNPEEPEALTLALALAAEKNADLVIGTDPDSDRLGIAVRDLSNNLVLLNGNQTMIIMTAFLLEQWQIAGKLNGKQFIGTTIVSTPMMFDLASAFNVECKVGLTGFKWIAKMIRDYPHLQFIGGGEESFGYMVGDKVRDKDAIAASLLICEIAAREKEAGRSLYQKLLALYLKYGLYREGLVSLTKKGVHGAAEIKQMMVQLRENPPITLQGSKIIKIEDYLYSKATDNVTGEISEIEMPKSDVLIFYSEAGDKIAARPSGTEPKIKFYVSAKTKVHSIEQIPLVSRQLDDRISAILKEMNII